jgi:hypothetical protein
MKQEDKYIKLRKMGTTCHFCNKGTFKQYCLNGVKCTECDFEGWTH